MAAAEKIMRKKAFIKAEMDRQFPETQSNALWTLAMEKLDEILTRYADLPKGVHMHTDSYIFPAAALYLMSKDVAGADRGKLFRMAYISGTEGKEFDEERAKPEVQEVISWIAWK